MTGSVRPAGTPAPAHNTEGDSNLSPGRTGWVQRRDARTRELLAQDEQWFLRQSLSTPCLDVVERAHDSSLVCLDGRELLDFHGNSVHQVGYGHPRVVAAVKAQLDELPFSPRRFTNRAAIELAARLVRLVPGAFEKVLLTPSGALAIETALKIARYATGRHRTVSFWDSFHGASLGAISVGGEELFRRSLGPTMPGTEHVPPLHLAERFFGRDGHAFDRLADYIDYALDVQGDVAAVVAEPIRWTTVHAPPPWFWARVRRSCDEHGALLIFDEIPSCLGRSGSMFAFEQLGAVPDVLAIGKGLGGGVVPLAAVMVGAGLDVAPDAALGHYTHEKSPIGAAAANATLDVIESEKLVQRAATLGAAGLARLRELAERAPAFDLVRGLGMYWGIETCRVGERPASQVADQVMYACMERGLSFKVGGGNVITLCPPLNITEHDLDRAFDILAAGAAAVVTDAA